MNPDGTNPYSKRHVWPWLAALLTGGLMTLCFPPFDISGCAFFALAPLLCAVWLYRPRRRAGLKRFFFGYVAGLVFFTCVFIWIGELAPLYNMPGLRFLPFLLSLYLALFPAVWAWFAGWLVGEHFVVPARPGPGLEEAEEERPKPSGAARPLRPKLTITAPPVENVQALDKWERALAETRAKRATREEAAAAARPPLLSSSRNLLISLLLAAAWTALEWVRGWLFTGFPWNNLGVALHAELALIQIVEFTGVGGLSFMLVLCNAIGVITILRFKAEIGRMKMRPHFDFSFTIALVVIVFGYGVRTLMRPPEKDAPVLRVAAIQPNIPQELKFNTDPERDADSEIREMIAKHHLIAAYGKPHLVLWPEASVPGGMFGSEDNLKYVLDLAAMVPALMLGTDDISRDAPGDDHNSAVLLVRGQQGRPQIYDKIRLVPFGEYVPLRPFFRWLPDEILNGDFKPGTEHKVFDLPDPGVKLGPIVCFEDTFAEVSRQPVLRGAQILVNLTNDGWFGKSSETRQHLNNSIFRAVENRRPLIRGTNGGTTAGIDPFGRVEIWAKPFQSETSSQPREVRYSANTATTFFTRHGELFSKICAALACLAIPGRIVLRRRAGARYAAARR